MQLAKHRSAATGSKLGLLQKADTTPSSKAQAALELDLGKPVPWGRPEKDKKCKAKRAKTTKEKPSDPGVEDIWVSPLSSAASSRRGSGVDQGQAAAAAALATSDSSPTSSTFVRKSPPVHVRNAPRSKEEEVLESYQVVAEAPLVLATRVEVRRADLGPLQPGLPRLRGCVCARERWHVRRTQVPPLP